MMWYNIGFIPKPKKASIFSYSKGFLGSCDWFFNENKVLFHCEKDLEEIWKVRVVLA